MAADVLDGGVHAGNVVVMISTTFGSTNLQRPSTSFTPKLHFSSGEV
jgi:hypothetical protein